MDNLHEEAAISTRFQCSQCESSFARKEHLTRHTKTHSQENSHVCSICRKKFNRSDSLLRHFSKHGQEPKASGRTKRACSACHGAKTKCDGEEPCKPCIKKGVECKYNSARASPPQGESDEVNTESSPSTLDHEQSPTASVLTPSQSFLTQINIRQDSSRDDSSVSSAIHANPEYADTYFTHFHHRFPIIHRVSYDDPAKGPVHPLLLPSIEMLGAWLQNTPQAREFAVERHRYLSAQCLLELSNISSADKFQQSIPSGVFQAALLNVAFGLYCGTEHAISRGVIIHSMMIAALRETGFLDQSYIWPDQRPGYFIPMGIMKAGERQRLTQQIYRLDTYLSSLRGTTRLISTEELIFTMPSSFSTWNTQGLFDWEERLRSQPAQRTTQPMSEAIKHLGNPNQCPGLALLVEDIHTSLCYVHTSLVHIQAQFRCRDQHVNDEAIAEITSLRTQLDCLKGRLDQITFGEMCAEALRSNYHGYEEQSDGWRDIVESRVQTLWFEATMLYHYLSLQLYVDPTRLTQVVNEFTLDLDTFKPDQQKVIGLRRCNTASWTSSPVGRHALCVSADILTAMQGLTMKPLIEPQRLDPIVYITVATAALTVWMHNHMGMYACSKCGPTMGFEYDPYNEVSLTPAIDIKISREEWISRMTASRVKIDGIEMCPCNMVKLLDMYHAFIPKDWQLAEVIAPGVFSAGLLQVIADRMKGQDYNH